MKVNEVHPDEIKEALTSLTKKQLDLLLLIYHSPGSLMTSKELEKVTGLRPIFVGTTGKRLGQLCGVEDFGSYKDGKNFSVAYYSMIGDYFPEYGWVMNANLRMAIKQYLKENT